MHNKHAMQRNAMQSNVMQSDVMKCNARYMQWNSNNKYLVYIARIKNSKETCNAMQ